jgi:rhodanese-related sulfurtransferase
MDYEISPEQTQALMDSGERFILLDVRESWEYEIARLEGAKLMPMGEVSARARRELDIDDQIVVYCHHGVRSLSVTHWLRQQGFAHTQSLRGGIDAWSREVDGKIPTY